MIWTKSFGGCAPPTDRSVPISLALAPAESPEQGSDGTDSLLVLDLFRLQEFGDLLGREDAEGRVVQALEAFQLARVEPYAIAIDAHIDANLAGIFSIHEAPAVRAYERAVGVEAQFLRE